MELVLIVKLALLFINMWEFLKRKKMLLFHNLFSDLSLSIIDKLLLNSQVHYK